MASLTRGLVVASTLLAVAAGLWPLQDRPMVLTTLAVIVAGAAALARWLPPLATVLVFLFAYVSYGCVRLIAGPEVAGIPFFLAAFAGLALGSASWTRWQAVRPWRLPLVWWALTVALTWPYVAARELGFSLAPSLAAGQIVTAALLQLSLALWMDHLLASRDDHSPRGFAGLPSGGWRVPLIASALATAGAALYQRWLDPAWLSGDPWITLGRAVGLMGDANPMGVATAMWAPLTAAAFAGSVGGGLAGTVLSVPLWLAAWASGARTTLILLAAGMAALVALATGALGWSRLRVVLAGAVLAVSMLAVVAVVGPSRSPTSPVGRLAASLSSNPQAAAYELFWHRDGYGTAAIAAFQEHPWFGVGVGRFWGLAPRYAQRAGLTIPPDNAQNLWRQTLVEQGLLGVIPVSWLTALTIMSLLRGRAQGLELAQRFVVAGLGISLLVGYPVQDPAIAMTVATLVCAVATHNRPR